MPMYFTLNIQTQQSLFKREAILPDWNIYELTRFMEENVNTDIKTNQLPTYC